MKAWVDGTLYDADKATVSVFDHGLTTGDGVFETVKVVGGRPFALTRHLARLARSAAGLGLPALDLDQVRAGVADALEANPQLSAAKVRITVTGGTASLGSDRGGAAPMVVIAVAPLPDGKPHCDVVVVPWPRNERGALAGLKTTSYGENVRALAYAKQHGGDEAIFGNIAGNLCEGTGSNVFVARAGRLVTPPLAAGCLAGVTRALVLEWAAAAEDDVPVDGLADADEACLVSTTRDVQPIRAVGGKPMAACPGPLTRKAMEEFARRSAVEIDP